MPDQDDDRSDLSVGSPGASQNQTGVTRKTRKALVWAGITVSVFAAIGGYLGYSYYSAQQRTRFLREADARLAIDDREGAIAALRAHILEHPGDYDTQIRLADLLVKVGNVESAKRVYQRVLEAEGLRSESRSEYLSAATDLASLLDSECTNLKKQAAELTKNNQYKEALELYERMRETCLSRPVLSALETVLWTKDSQKDLRTTAEYQYKSIIDSYNEALAARAYVEWLSGDQSAMEVTLATADIDFDIYSKLSGGQQGGVLQDALQKIPFKRREKFSDLVRDHADELYKQKDWKQAAAAYKMATEQRVQALGGRLDGLAGEHLFNEAVAEFSAGQYSIAVDHLKELQEKLPDYEKDDVRKTIADAREAEHREKEFARFNECDRLESSASSAFKKKNWITAVARFNDVARCLVSNGYSEGSEIVAECRYNMAMAYVNAGKYREAEVTLLSVQKKSPRYQPLLVAEQLKDVQETLRRLRE